QQIRAAIFSQTLAPVRGFSFCRMNALRVYVETAVAQHSTLAVAPDNRVTCEPADPNQRAQNILQGQQPPLPAGQRITENKMGSGCGRGATQRQGDGNRRPGCRDRCPEKKRPGERISENLSPVAGRTRTACAASPANAMPEICCHSLAANAMLNHA